MKKKILFLLVFIILVVSSAMPTYASIIMDKDEIDRSDHLSINTADQAINSNETQFISEELKQLIVDYHLAHESVHSSQVFDVSHVTNYLDMYSHTGLAAKEALLTNIAIEKCSNLLGQRESQNEFSIAYYDWEVIQLSPDNYQVFVFQLENNPYCYVRYNSFSGLFQWIK